MSSKTSPSGSFMKAMLMAKQRPVGSRVPARVSADVDDHASAHLALDDFARDIHDVVEGNMRGHGGELRLVEFLREAAPGLDALRLRALDALDAEQRHSAQDEGRDAGRQVHALREAAGGDRAVVFG